MDIRIIAATNKDLEEAIKNKEFREDLYYRLNVVPVILPPLRERGNDILLLANKFLIDYNHKFNKKIEGFTENSEKALLEYEWQGNVRELKNVIERVVLLSDGKKISVEDLLLKKNDSDNVENHFLKTENKIFDDGFSLEKEVERMERYYIKQALKLCDNNYSKTAEMLGISRFAFKRRIDKYF